MCQLQSTFLKAAGDVFATDYNNDDNDEMDKEIIEWRSILWVLHLAGV